MFALVKRARLTAFWDGASVVLLGVITSSILVSIIELTEEFKSEIVLLSWTPVWLTLFSKKASVLFCVAFDWIESILI